ncbi:MAG: hypothetical protein M1818_005504 [Claussenomyces sp. TS43310]|nr:MAG: hypothetical protein M1818_005504 [Claussenomyces sp. TS43310]
MAYNQYPPYGAPQPPYGTPPPRPYGAPPGQPSYAGPPPSGYQQPPYGGPPGQPSYGGPPPPPPSGYQQPPYGGPPGQPPYGGAPAPSNYQQQPYGSAPPPNNYQQPQYPAQGYQGYGAPQGYSPTPPSLGYGPAQQIPYDPNPDADALRKAMKGFGTDEKALVDILATKDPLQINLIRQAFNHRHRRDLETDIKGETSGYFEEGLCALVRGPLLQDCYVLHNAMVGLGTKESDLNDVLLSRSNADMHVIKETYQRVYRRSLEGDLKGDLSMKTERHFMMVVAGNRTEDSVPPNPGQVDQDVMELYKAMEGRIGTDEVLVCSILTNRNDAQIRAIAYAYEQKFRKNLESVIKKEFSGHMESALLHQLRGGVDRAARDATLLEHAMAGAGTKDHQLVNRVIRYHWDRNHLPQVKGAYKHLFHRDLAHRVRAETSGHYEKLMLACLGER